MKKLTILFIAVFALTACAQSPKGQEIIEDYEIPKSLETTETEAISVDWDNIEMGQRIVDYIGFGRFSDVKKNDFSIVEAEVINEFYGNSSVLEIAFADLRVTKVFQGNVKEGDVIKLGLNYFIQEVPGIPPRIINCSDLVPLRNGEKWIFIIDTFEDFVTQVPDVVKGAYFLNGDTSGKFPIPDEKKLDVVKKFDESKAKIDEYMLSVKKTAKIVPEEKLSEYDSKTASGEISGKMVYDETGSYIVSDEQYEKITSLWREQDDLRFSLNPGDYGIRNIGYFNMDLYADICGEFYGNG